MKNVIEDIFPLTIINMRCGGFAIIEGTSNYTCVDKLENDIEICDDPESYMEKEWESVRYGIGNDINSAFIDFKEKYKL